MKSIFQIFGSFVVHNICRWLHSCLLKLFILVRPCYSDVFCSSIVNGCCQDCISIVVVAYEDILVSASRLVRETASKISEGCILAVMLVSKVAYLVCSFVGRW